MDEIQDTPTDRMLMRHIAALFPQADGFVHHGAAIEDLNDLWGQIARHMTGLSDDAYAEIEARFTAAASDADVRTRGLALFALVTDWSWEGWAAKEQLAGRNPYVAAQPTDV